MSDDGTLNRWGSQASPYLAAWVISRLVSREAAENALRIVAPVGEKTQYVPEEWQAEEYASFVKDLRVVKQFPAGNRAIVRQVSQA
jgi:hypothetical protein